jgi:hypothetical protein
MISRVTEGRNQNLGNNELAVARKFHQLFLPSFRVSGHWSATRKLQPGHGSLLIGPITLNRAGKCPLGPQVVPLAS